MFDKKSIWFAVISSVLFLILYGILMFALKLSLSVYAVIHVIFAFIIVLLISKLNDKNNSIKLGLIISAVVGLLLLIPNFLIYNMNKQVVGTNSVSMLSAPNPIIYLLIFVVVFNIPFLLYSKLSLGKTALFLGLLLVVIFVSSPLYNMAKLGCSSFTCNSDGCFCKYTTVTSGACPTCADVCYQKGKTELKTTLPSAFTPVSVKQSGDGFVASSSSTQCYCYCK